MSPSTITLLFLAFAVVMFVWEKIPLALTAMIVCIGLTITGVLDAKAAFAGFVNSNVILCVAMFIVGQALFETGMANKIGSLVTRFAKTERQCIIAVMLITGLMSGFLSNTGTAAVLIPVVIGIAASSDFSRGKLLMPLVFAAALGGKLLPDNKDLVSADDDQFAAKDFSGVPVWKQTASLVILILSILAMIFEKQIGVKLHVSASVGAIILILTGVISEKEALRSIDLKTVFLFGGSLALASALETTGAGTLVANAIIHALGDTPSPFLLLLVIWIITCALTNFMSNTATTALMVPIAVALAQGVGADPRAVVVATVIAGSCAYATPIGMPANTMVVGIGGYSFRDYVKVGLPLIGVSFVICMVLLPILFPFFPG